MAVPLLLGSNSNTLSAAERFSAATRGLRLLGWTGFLAVLLGVSDLAFAVATLPHDGSDATFASLATAFGHLMLLGVGAGALAASALGLGVRWYQRAVGVLCTMLTLGLIVVLVIWSPSAVDALGAELPVVQRANAREAARVLFTALAFGALFATLAGACFRARAGVSRNAAP